MAKEHLGIQEPAYVLLGKIEAKPMYLLEVRSARGKAFLNQGLVDMFFFFFFRGRMPLPKAKCFKALSA